MKRNNKIMRVIGCAVRGRSKGAWHESEHRQMLEVNSEHYSNAITTFYSKDNLIAEIYETL